MQRAKPALSEVERVDGISTEKNILSKQGPGSFVNSDRFLNAIHPAVVA
jgi:hypothetical protein